MESPVPAAGGDAPSNAVDDAMERGEFRPATKKETMALRLAALSAIVRKMQELVENDRELANS
ncbi:MAG: hypothetical protein LBK02_08545 [Treponema sp.]|nr:hypothetical protein [Treponema sp.]